MSSLDQLKAMRSRWRRGWLFVVVDSAAFSITSFALLGFLLTPDKINAWAFVAVPLTAACAASLGWTFCQQSWRRMIIKCFDETEKEACADDEATHSL